MESRKLSYLRNSIVILLVYAVLFFLISSGTINSYYSGIVTMILINIIITVSLNLTVGFLGQLALGNAGFMAIGAYVSAIFTKTAGLPIYIAFPIALILAGIVAAVFGVLIGVPALRLKGDYLAIITLAFNEIIRNILLNLEITNGAKGYKGIPFFSNFTVTFFIMCLTIFVVFTLINSRHGRAILSIREDEIAAEAAGINTTYYKLFAFSTSAFFAGMGGALYAHYITVIEPRYFDFNRSIEMVIMIVLGGMGSITGSILSAALLTALPQILSGFDKYRMLFYSLLLIIIMIFKPSGILGKYEFSLSKLISKSKNRKGSI